MQYDLEDSDRAARGTAIHAVFERRGQGVCQTSGRCAPTLEKHCQFMPVPICVSEVKAPKEGEEQKEAPAPEQINDTIPCG